MQVGGRDNAFGGSLVGYSENGGADKIFCLPAEREDCFTIMDTIMDGGIWRNKSIVFTLNCQSEKPFFNRLGCDTHDPGRLDRMWNQWINLKHIAVENHTMAGDFSMHCLVVEFVAFGAPLPSA